MEEKKIAQEQANAAQQERPRENKMGTMPVKKLLISMALPMMISMLVQALYNVVDSIFVARIEEDALTRRRYRRRRQCAFVPLTRRKAL